LCNVNELCCTGIWQLCVINTTSVIEWVERGKEREGERERERERARERGRERKGRFHRMEWIGFVLIFSDHKVDDSDSAWRLMYKLTQRSARASPTSFQVPRLVLAKNRPLWRLRMIPMML